MRFPEKYGICRTADAGEAWDYSHALPAELVDCRRIQKMVC